MSTTSSAVPPSTGEGDILEELKAELAQELEDERPPHAGPLAQVGAGVATLALGVAGVVLSLGYGLGSLTQPGPGLWPFAVSVAVTAMSLAQLVFGRSAEDTEQFTRSSALTALGVASLVALAMLLPVVGFEVPSLVLMAVWLRFLGGESWRMTAIVSVATVASMYGLFVLALSIPLPRLI
ncbi:tripartite tricarboxylate transporter TctB family protein [Phycicoccus sp. M110.8]|uniref:tripartite tricarboxylate transporter TctB family protein n=1 Tax=Phycicoccus sp. M110.8 TaxID=3075433 RepID=UPI0028FD5830|nr:tripartite tricarboxylate transporter TctB family protein [Phycicoccus sp. M110.8]MDU0315054.1 tripartite tricarboxylate transporter TctB family protein [Phycicoccus sp. M110.8]